MALIYQQYMTPRWLENTMLDRNGRPITPTTEYKLQGHTMLLSQRKKEKYQKLLLIKLQDHLAPEVKDYIKIFRNDVLTFAIDVSLNYRCDGAPSPNETTSSLCVVLTEFGYKQTNNAIGFKLEGDVKNYGVAKKGPYCGIKGALNGSASDSLANVTLIDSPEEPGTTTSTSFPTQFRILIKPTIGWGACYSGLDNGHLHTVDYQMKLNLTNSQVALGLFSDEDTDDDSYSINHIDLSIYKED